MRYAHFAPQSARSAIDKLAAAMQDGKEFKTTGQEVAEG
jgi:hypothetical protein